ncbi:MAG: hypothetical protein E6672_06270 [Negativicoccus succinicivorans]|nr:hypothetical protein [Negativicoccus succinicivorans]
MAMKKAPTAMDAKEKSSTDIIAQANRYSIAVEYVDGSVIRGWRIDAPIGAKPSGNAYTYGFESREAAEYAAQTIECFVSQILGENSKIKFHLNVFENKSGANQ